MYIVINNIVSSLGLNLSKTVSSFHQSSRSFKRERNYIGLDGLRQIVSPIWSLDEYPDCQKRLIALVGALLEGCPRDQRVPLFLCLPDWMSLYDDVNSQKDKITEVISPGSSDDIFVCYFGKVPTFEIISTVRKFLSSGAGDTAQVLTVDSYINSDLLCHLEETSGLLSKSDPFGVIPGEAATLSTLSLNPIFNDCLELVAVSSAYEELYPWVSDRPILGETLCDRVNVLSDLLVDWNPFQRIWYEQNGERWRSEELGMLATMQMISEQAFDNIKFIAPCFGDIGINKGFFALSFEISDFENQSPALFLESLPEGGRSVLAARKLTTRT